MQLVAISSTNRTNAAQAHFKAAFDFYAGHGQQHSAIAQMAAGMLAMSIQLTRIELELGSHGG